jgi:hypothetical protein
MRGEPQPVIWLVLAQGLGLLLLAGWWATLPAQERDVRLAALAYAEEFRTLPPAGVLEQLPWLLEERWARLYGGVGLAGLLLGIGACEGTLRRRRDTLGGFLLRWWTTAVLTLALLPGVVGGALLAPTALGLRPVALVCALLVGVAGYGLAAGRPYVA